MLKELKVLPTWGNINFTSEGEKDACCRQKIESIAAETTYATMRLCVVPEETRRWSPLDASVLRGSSGPVGDAKKPLR